MVYSLLDGRRDAFGNLRCLGLGLALPKGTPGKLAPPRPSGGGDIGTHQEQRQLSSGRIVDVRPPPSGPRPQREKKAPPPDVLGSQSVVCMAPAVLYNGKCVITGAGGENVQGPSGGGEWTGSGGGFQQGPSAPTSDPRSHYTGGGGGGGSPTPSNLPPPPAPVVPGAPPAFVPGSGGFSCKPPTVYFEGGCIVPGSGGGSAGGTAGRRSGGRFSSGGGGGGATSPSSSVPGASRQMGPRGGLVAPGPAPTPTGGNPGGGLPAPPAPDTAGLLPAPPAPVVGGGSVSSGTASGSSGKISNMSGRHGGGGGRGRGGWRGGGGGGYPVPYPVFREPLVQYVDGPPSNTTVHVVLPPGLTTSAASSDIARSGLLPPSSPGTVSPLLVGALVLGGVALLVALGKK